MKKKNPGSRTAAQQAQDAIKKKRTLRRRAKRDAVILQKLSKILTVSNNLSKKTKVLQARIDELERENTELKGKKGGE